MSMFDKRKGQEPSGEAADPTPAPGPRPRMTEAVSSARDIAVIGSSVIVKGDVTGEESLVIDGRVEGTVVLRSFDLTIGQAGVVTASVKARTVRIEGQVTGDIDGAEKVIVTRTGRVKGNIVAPRVTLEDGAKFKGSIDMNPESAEVPKPLQSVPPAKPASVGSPPKVGP